MYLSFAPTPLGIQTSLTGALDLAARHGFEGVDSSSSQLAALSAGEIAALAQQFEALNVRPGYFGLDPVVISAPNEAWHNGVELLKTAAPVAKDLGYTRAIAVVLPFSETRPFAENFEFHLARLGEIEPILAENGVSLGLEYVAPLTRRAPYPHHFIHDLRGALELIAAAKSSNLGLLLDSFHWFCAGESGAQIAALKPSQIVAVHLNDAIKNRPRDEQVAFERELPGESGEIDLKSFIQALKTLGYDGPLTCEPMNKVLNALNDDEATARTFAAMQKVTSLAP
jgi:sugar phosphate isomerase/epimerase